MKSTIVASALALFTLTNASPSARARRQAAQQNTAILQFEIAPDTFTSNTEITLGTVLDFDAQPLQLLSVGVVSAQNIVCQALDQSTVVGVFTPVTNAVFPSFQTITSITCDAVTGRQIVSSSSAVAPVRPTATTMARVASTTSSTTAATATATAIASAAGTATVQLEIEPDTFIQTSVTLGTVIDTDVQAISATIAVVEGAKNANNVVCQATRDFSSNVAGTFTLATEAVFGNGKQVDITSISCAEKV